MDLVKCAVDGCANRPRVGGDFCDAHVPRLSGNAQGGALVTNVTRYKVLADGTSRWPRGLQLGVVAYRPNDRVSPGWYFTPYFQRGRSRRGWPTAAEALQGRVSQYYLEPQS